MSGQALAPPHAAVLGKELRAALPALALGLVALGLVFHTEIVAGVEVWIESTAYNHCFLVLPIVLYLIWDRRAVLAGAVPEPLPVAALAGLPIGGAWFIADRLGIMEGRQLMAMCLVELLFLAVLGWRLYRALLGPLLYLFFLVPFGAFITPLLQDVTAAFTTHGLDLLGIPNFSDAYSIEIPEGTFYIAEACAGLRFLIAAIAFGCLYALLMYRSPLRRGLFILVSIIVPVIANGFRALGIVVLGHVLGSAQAAATDHVLYGWVFFSIVILLLVVLGLPFREDERPAVPLAPNPAASPARARSSFGAVLSVIAVAVVGPLAVAGFDRASAAALSPDPPALALGGCTATAPIERSASGAPGRLLVQHVACEGAGLQVQLELFSPRSDPGAVLAEQRRLLAMNGEISTTTALPMNGVTWRLIQTDDPWRSAASALWLGGRQAGSGLRVRLRQGWASLIGGHLAPVAMIVRPDPDPSGQPGGMRQAKQTIVTYLKHQP
ncbi:MAG TPA: exosortase A, partial [Acetobacteraceae bacterium]|nr:exosortase A [Acetobacteraceae bacterium]